MFCWYKSRIKISCLLWNSLQFSQNTYFLLRQLFTCLIIHKNEYVIMNLFWLILFSDRRIQMVSSGQLLVRNVSTLDSPLGFRCRAVHTLTGETHESAHSAHVYVTGWFQMRSGWVTRYGLGLITFDWFKICCSQSNAIKYYPDHDSVAQL